MTSKLYFSTTKHMKDKNYKDSFIRLIEAFVKNNVIKYTDGKLNLSLTENINKYREITSKMTLQQIKDILNVL